MSEYKAWYNPDSDLFNQFSTNGLHSDIAQEKLHQGDEIEAIKHGYYRIFVGHEVNIDSWDVPSDREFNAVKNTIEDNSYKKFNGTRWSTFTKGGYFYFPKQAFLFADSIKNATYKSR